MSKNKWFHLLAASTLIVFVLSAILTVPAMADSGTTPPPADPSSSGRTSNKGSSNSLSQVPIGTKIVVLDNQGDKLPLGSQAAQEIVDSGDPIWCPSTVSKPLGSGLNGCTYSESDLHTLISDIQSHTALVVPNTNGTIWIEGGPDSSSAIIVIDGSDTADYGNWANFSLTLKGGWDGTYGSSSVNQLDPSTLGRGIKIINWNNNIAISDVQVNSCPSCNGFDIETTKNISLTRVEANGDAYDGAYLDNTATGSGTGTVTVTDSIFSGNNGVGAGPVGSYGLDIFSNGAVTLTGVQVTGNLAAGAYVDNHAISAQTVTINGASTFGGNAGDGLQVYSKGLITVTDLTASDNTAGAYGADLVNTFGTAGVTLTGTDIFDGNAGDGLDVLSNGAITSGSLSANDNGGLFGAQLQNNAGSAGVTLTGTSSFSGNTVGDGLDVYSKGAITVNNITAADNAGNGVYLDNRYLTITSAVKVTGTNSFLNNSAFGLHIDSYGAILLNNLTASDNVSGGLLADNYGTTVAEGVTLTGNTTASHNGGSGLYIDANGAVSLNNVTAVCNGYTGACITGTFTGGVGLYIQNDTLTSSKPQSVTLLGTNDISLNHGANLDVTTFGAITISNLTADDSATDAGANLYYGGSDVSGKVTLTGINNFNNNGGKGLNVDSDSTVTLSNLTADSNNDIGVDIDNHTGVNSAVTLSGLNTFNNNASDGLLISSSGKVTASSLTANSNGQASSPYGVVINNVVSSALSVTLTGTNTFDYNYNMGLSITSQGAITVSNLNENGGVGLGLSTYSHSYGVDLTNTAGTAGITLTGTNTFNMNAIDGLLVESGGSITASNLTANENGAGGADLINTVGIGKVTFTGTNTFDENYGLGLEVTSHGAIALNNLIAIGNGTGSSAYGAYIVNTGGTPQSVILTGVNLFNDNSYTGVSVTSLGAITASNVSANDNGFEGGNFNNGGSGTGGISLTGTNVFSNNGGSEGVLLLSNGAVSATHIAADYNYDIGMQVVTTSKVTVTCGSFIGNGTELNLAHGYGWTTTSVSSVAMIGTDAAANYNANEWTTNGGVTPVFTPRTCTLP